MKRIYKYDIHVDCNKVYLPKGYEILRVGAQEGKLYLWALVDPERECVDVKIDVIGTGWNVPDSIGKYIGTVDVGSLVWHVFHSGEVL